MTRIRKLIAAVSGFLYSLSLMLIHGTYRGQQRIYEVVQSDRDSWAKSIVLGLLQSPFREIFRRYDFLKENIDREGLSSLAVQQYSNDSLSGYGDINFQKGGKTLQEQQRGLILPLLEKGLTEANGNARTVVEIGTGNGDVLKYLAEKHPNHRYVGVDFSVKNAEIQYGTVPQIKFVKGYALELLEKQQLNGEIVFGSSTFAIFTPKELSRYFHLFKKAGFKQILLNEPSWSSYRQENNGKAYSKHLEGSIWFHNYAGYLTEAGFKIVDFNFFHYKHPISARPDIHISLIRGVSS